jgi:hypothetical protein
MNKVTTRLDNDSIITIAKQRYETQQRSKLPSIIVPLASEGKIYPKTHPLHEGKLEMRYMTAYDEDILTNASYIREGILFDKLLESIIISDINIADIAPLDRDGLIIYARIVSYGAEYPVTVTEPRTKQILERTVDLRNIQSKPFALIPDDNGEFSYETPSGAHIKFAYNYKTSDANTISELLSRLIRQVGNSRKHEDVEQFIRYEFLAGESKQFRKYVTENAPGLDFRYEFEGENGGTFTAGFQVGSDLFWF